MRFKTRKKVIEATTNLEHMNFFRKSLETLQVAPSINKSKGTWPKYCLNKSAWLPPATHIRHFTLVCTSKVFRNHSEVSQTFCNSNSSQIYRRDEPTAATLITTWKCLRAKKHTEFSWRKLSALCFTRKIFNFDYLKSFIYADASNVSNFRGEKHTKYHPTANTIFPTAFCLF